MPKFIFMTVLTLVLMASCGWFLAISADVEEVDIVVPKVNQVGALSREEVRRIFMSEKS